MKKATVAIVIVAVLAGLGWIAYTMLIRSREAPTGAKSVAIIVPVRIKAIDSFTENAGALLEAKDVTVHEFSAEGDPARFESVIKAALLRSPDALIIFGTQLTDTALGAQFRDSAPSVVASAISDPASLDSLVAIGVDPPRTSPVAVISDTPKQDIYKQSASVIGELLQDSNAPVGILYNESEKNSKTTAEQLAKALETSGVEPRLGAITSSEDVIPVTKALILKGSRLIVIPHDKYALPKAGAIVKLCLEALPGDPIPVFSLDDGVVRDSGVAVSVSVNYGELGQFTAAECLKILAGDDPARMPVATVEKATVYVNTDALAKAGCTLTHSTMQSAIDVGQNENK